VTDKHGDERRTDINPMPLSMDREDLIEEKAVVISLTEDDYIRHTPVEAFRIQKRGGRGVKGVATKTEDAAKAIVSCFSKDRILIFTNKPFIVDEEHQHYGRMDGRVYGIKAWETPQASRQSKGSHIRNVLNKIQDDEEIISILPITKEMESNAEEYFIFFATRKGRVKKTTLAEYTGSKSINKNGKRAIILPEGDQLISVRIGNDQSNIVLISNKGNACRFNPSTLKERKDAETGEIKLSPILRPLGRNTQPKIGIKLHRKNPTTQEIESLGHVVGMIVSDNEETLILTITKYGKAKRSRLGDGKMHEQFDEDNNPKIDLKTGKVETKRDGFGITSRGMQGSKCMGRRKEGVPAGVNGKKWITEMTNKEKIEWHNNKFPENPLKSVPPIEKLWPEDEIIRVHQVPDDDDQIFLLAASGMMIRFKAYNEEKDSRREVGRGASGNWVMEVRDKINGGFSDEVISSARLPAHLIDESDDDELEDIEEEINDENTDEELDEIVSSEEE
jgi:DNA gyrase subunit A